MQIALFVGVGVLLVLAGVLVGRRSLRARVRRLLELNGELEEGGKELRQVVQQLEDSYEDLRRAEANAVNNARVASLGSLVAGVAHEMNTPLGSLHAGHDTFRRALSRLQEILADERVDPDELDEVRRIIKAVDRIARSQDLAFERLSSIVGELRTFGRPDAAEVSVVDLHEGIESTLTVVAHELGDRVTVEREYGVIPAVECHPHRINQVFMNLLVNAIHAIHGPGRIVIRTASEGDEVTVEVEDTGVGISEEDLPHIFDAGFTTKEARKGMGLGLLISQQIVQQHGGQLDVRSRRGEGTTFTLTLPVRMPAQGEREVSHAAPAAREVGS